MSRLDPRWEFGRQIQTQSSSHSSSDLFAGEFGMLEGECRMQSLTSRLYRQILFGNRTTKPIYNRPN
jgi:hypothetical protein